MNIQWFGSPNYWEGRTQPITKIVMHWMAGTLAATDRQFQLNAGTDEATSAHYGIEDNVVHQYVRDEDTAFHAAYGRVTANPYSIGIEHSSGPGRPASEATINTSAQLVVMLCSLHSIPIDRDHIVKHSDIIATQCPGTLPVDTIINKARAISEGVDEMPDSGSAVNLLRMARGDLNYNPPQTEIDQAKNISYKDWVGIIGQPNDGDAINYLRAEKSDPKYNPTKSEINAIKVQTHKMVAYKLAGIASKSEFTLVTEELYSKK